MQERVFQRILYFICFIIIASTTFAQEKNQKNLFQDSTSVYMFYNKIDSADTPLFLPYNPELSGIEKSNFSWRNASFADLGNTGQAQRNLLFEYQKESGFRYKSVPYYSYITNTTHPIFFRSILPYSEFYYHLGAKKEQVVGVDFSANLFQGLTLGVLFDLTFCPGSYPNQRSSTSDLSINMRYFTPNYRYGIIGSISYYNIKANENGGITNDSIFETQTEMRPEATPVNLPVGTTTIENIQVDVTQYFSLTKPSVIRKKQDSSMTKLATSLLDSLNSKADTLIEASLTSEKRKFNWGKFALRTKLTSFSWVYNNPQIPRDFFPNYFNDSLKTYDSTRMFVLENTFSYSNANLQSKNPSNIFRYYLYLKHQYIHLNENPQQNIYDSLTLSNYSHSYNQLIPKVQIATRLFNTFELRATGDYVLNGYNKQDFSLSGSIEKTFGKGKNKSLFNITIFMASQMPDWFYSYYSGNHYRWKNNFQKVNYYTLSTGVSTRWFALHGDYFLLSNYVYLNKNALPETTQHTQHVLKIGISSKIQIGKHWTLDNMLAFQNSFNSEAIHLPTFLYNGTFYYGMSLFKNTLIVMPGISLFYNTSYYADAYTPALNAFYMQQDKHIGNYLYSDFFINFNIKRARIFVKYRHFDKALLKNTEMGYSYYMVPHYPQINGGFYAGISWRFIN